ncbi:unnamed protein product [Prorocentrum cordatum]|uniref:Uncharacterized protein n=1 Tax=Prorocentrum cordatum TaxID=2364126 RepID=A0ABN9WVK9_9DINO|nr:unnamed protein product [Polarella glacialis]
MAGPGRGDEGAPSLDINCVVDALQEQKAMLAQILERLPPARGDQHARFGPRIMDSHEVARSEVVQVELESKSTCGSGGEHAALADGVRAETPPQNPGPLQAIVSTGIRPIPPPCTGCKADALRGPLWPVPGRSWGRTESHAGRRAGAREARWEPREIGEFGVWALSLRSTGDRTTEDLRTLQLVPRGTVADTMWMIF